MARPVDFSLDPLSFICFPSRPPGGGCAVLLCLCLMEEEKNWFKGRADKVAKAIIFMSGKNKKKSFNWKSAIFMSANLDFDSYAN